MNYYHWISLVYFVIFLPTRDLDKLAESPQNGCRLEGQLALEEREKRD